MSFKKLKEIGKKIWEKIKKGAKWTYENILIPAWQKIKPALIKAAKEIKEALVKAVKRTIEAIKKIIIDIIDNWNVAKDDKKKYDKPLKIEILKYILKGPKMGYDEWKTERELADAIKELRSETNSTDIGLFFEEDEE